MKLEKKEDEDSGGGVGMDVVKQRPRKKIFENIKFEEEVKALREAKEKFLSGEKENSCPNEAREEVSGVESWAPIQSTPEKFPKNPPQTTSTQKYIFTCRAGL